MRIIKIYYLPLLIILFTACKPEYKKCAFKTDDVYLQAYNDVLNEIIIHGTYHRYLGSNEEKVFNMYADSDNDSDKIKQADEEVINLHNKLFGDSTQFCSIYLKDTLRHPLYSWAYLQEDTNTFTIELRNIINEFPGDKQTIIDFLHTPQKKYHAPDFKSGVAYIKPYEDLNKNDTICFIGSIVFSNLVLDKQKEHGLLYYEFRCGGLCGYGYLISIKKTETGWKTDKERITWIS